MAWQIKREGDAKESEGAEDQKEPRSQKASRTQLPNLESGVVLLLLSSSLQCIGGGVFFFRFNALSVFSFLPSEYSDSILFWRLDKKRSIHHVSLTLTSSISTPSGPLCIVNIMNFVCRCFTAIIVFICLTAIPCEATRAILSLFIHIGQIISQSIVVFPCAFFKY